MFFNYSIIYSNPSHHSFFLNFFKNPPRHQLVIQHSIDITPSCNIILDIFQKKRMPYHLVSLIRGVSIRCTHTIPELRGAV